MKNIVKLAVVSAVLFLSGCNMAQLNEDLATDNRDLSYQISEDQDLMAGWLGSSLEGDNSWNDDGEGNPIWEDEKKSIALTSKAAKLAADELLDNAKKSNEK